MPTIAISMTLNWYYHHNEHIAPLKQYACTYQACKERNFDSQYLAQMKQMSTLFYSTSQDEFKEP